MAFNTCSDMTYRTIPKSQDLLNKMDCEENKNTNKTTQSATNELMADTNKNTLKEDELIDENDNGLTL